MAKVIAYYEVSQLAVSNLILPDHEADVFISPLDPELPHLWGDYVVEALLGGLVRWDAQYFLHVAEYGYSHENTLAFFPLFPLTVRYFANVLYIVLQFICNFHSTLIIAATLLNFFLFVQTAVILYKLSIVILKNEQLAYYSALLFCINPATIFFTAPYSESFYAFLTFSALFLNETRSTTFSSVPFGLASAARSNGLVNIGFILYRKLKDCSSYYYNIRSATTETGSLSLPLVVLLTFNYTLLPLFIGCLTVIIPFVLFQLWCYFEYCSEPGTIPPLRPHLEMYVRTNFLHSPDLDMAEWCYNFPPLAYSHVQDKYWEVGLLRYYQVRQLPNFLMALPVVMIIISHAALYFVDNPQVVWALGIPISLHHQDKKMREKKYSKWEDEGINSWRVFVYTFHSICLCAFCVLFIHIQVTTRLICSSCPVIYWFAAHIVSCSESKISKGTSEEVLLPISESVSNLKRRYKVSLLSKFPQSFWGQVILCYFILYASLGTVLFSNFLPWT